MGDTSRLFPVLWGLWQVYLSRGEVHTAELRATMSLSRLWQQQGQRAAAYTLLTQVYSWFSKGFDTADIQEARTLLEALAG